LFRCLFGAAADHTFAQRHGAAAPGAIRVTLQGTASGPRVHPGTAGISTLVETGGERLLFDAGRGCMQQLVPRTGIEWITPGARPHCRATHASLGTRRLPRRS